MTNRKIVTILSEMSVLMEMQNVPFKPRAFDRAARAIELLEQDLKDIYKQGGIKALEEIPGVGKGIAERIEEFIKTGHIREYQALKKKFSMDIQGLSSIEGVGPKMILKLYKKLSIRTRVQLEKAAQEGKLARLGGLGKKTQDNILRSIGFLKQTHGRFILGFVMPTVHSILERIKEVPGVQRAEFAGSIRRMQETVGDLDILVISEHPQKVMDFFVSMPEVKAVYGQGPTKSSVRLDLGMDADLRVLPPESFGAALQYFTGDKYHNVQLRQLAMKKGYKLNEYGLFKGKKLIAGRNEEELYDKLGLKWMPPEIRTNSGELEAAANGRLPHLVGYGDLKGDLQVQTDWTDGENSIEEMAKAAKAQGLEYICITDHTKSLAMTGGSDEKKLLRQMAEIDKIQKKLPGIKLLKGAEVNINKDGTLDIVDEVLAKLDVVGAAVHSHFNLSEQEQTARIIRAMENPNVDILFHPTGRIIQRREPCHIDMQELLKAARRTKTVLEIDAYPSRLDLKDEYIRQAVPMGIKLAIDTDAHAASHFPYLEFGIAQARRGWAKKKDIINTRGWKEMLELLK